MHLLSHRFALCGLRVKFLVTEVGVEMEMEMGHYLGSENTEEWPRHPHFPFPACPHPHPYPHPHLPAVSEMPQPVCVMKRSVRMCGEIGVRVLEP